MEFGHTAFTASTAMHEGIIRFTLEFAAAPALPHGEITEIEGLRQRLRGARVLGQDPDRYGGYGFGNVSRRLAPYGETPTARRYLITGTQTGVIPRLTGDHYAVVRECYPDENRVVAEGPVPPSSESLTHGIVYALDDSLRWVIHAHAPTLWREAALLRLPTTHPAAAQGTPEMSREVKRLFTETDVRAYKLFAMGGHEDGLVAFGRTAAEASEALFSKLEAVERS